MRVTEQEQGGLLVGTLRFEIIPVNLEMVVAGQPQHTLRHLAAIVADAREEAVVVGRQYDHLLARHRQRLDSHRHGGHHPRCIHDFLSTDPPLVATLEPADNGIVIVLTNMRIAKHAVLRPFPHSIQDGRCRLEIHISHPQRNDVPCGVLIPFHAARPASLNQFIEIISHSAAKIVIISLTAKKNEIFNAPRVHYSK